MIKYLTVEKFDNTKLVKTFMTPKQDVRWRIYSHNAENNMEDLKYYKSLGDIFGITPYDMIRIPQNHTDNIMIAKKEDGGKGVVRMEVSGDFDGIITNEKGLMLLTIEADCTPVYILDPVSKVIGMVHSGWRGTVNEISEKAIDIMIENYGTNKKDVMIYLGPAICGNCYEVGMDLIPEFKKILSCEEIYKFFKPMIDKPEKYLIDVTEAIRLSLIKYGIDEKNIERSNFCTYHSDIFFSWRKTKDRTKQMLTGIMLL